jgi:hypothetical protein
LQIPENFLATFLIVMFFTSFQHPSGIALKWIGLKQAPMNFGSITAPPSALFDLHAVAT